MKFNTLFRTILLITSLLAACGAPTAEPTAASDTSISLTDGLNRTVSLATPAEHVISLAPSNTEILFAIDAGEQVVGRDAASDYPAEALSITDIGDTYAGLNSEIIVSLQPDLVLAAEITPVEYVAELEQLGLTVFWLANPTDLDGLYTNLNIVAQLTGREVEAIALIESLQGRAATVEAALAGVTEKPTVFYELDATDSSAPWTAGGGTFIDLLITKAGGQNAGAVLDGDYAQISIEELLVQNPDVILLGDAAYGVTVESIAARAGWDQLAAVQTGQVFPFDDNLVSRPGPRLIDALEQLVRLLHPDQFN